MLNVDFRYTLLYNDLCGFLSIPVPFLPYPGIRALFMDLVILPLVLADIDFFKLGFRIPNFSVLCYRKIQYFMTERL